MTVYVINRGCYSDRYIVGVYSEKQKAERVVELMETGSEYYGKLVDIEEYELDEYNPGEPPQGMLPYEVVMFTNGKSRVSRCSIEDFELHQCMIPSSDWNRHWLFRVFAKDREHAIKIANEQRAQLIANGEW